MIAGGFFILELLSQMPSALSMHKKDGSINTTQLS